MLAFFPQEYQHVHLLWFKKIDFYFSVKTKSYVRDHFLNILIIFASGCAYLRACADTASINPNRSQWKRLSWRDQCNDSCYNVLRLCNGIVEHSGTDISHTKLFYFPNIIGLVQRIVRFVMRTKQFNTNFCIVTPLIHTHIYIYKT